MQDYFEDFRDGTAPVPTQYKWPDKDLVPTLVRARFAPRAFWGMRYEESQHAYVGELLYG